ncbi:MAG: hypothetical protein Q3963_04730 [Coriobacteriaceae bacterium]|nr:hypothetical protein [Coriobacteriaceae bacterium]
MDYSDASNQLKELLQEAVQAGDVAEAALELAGAVHAEALLASLAAFNQAARIAQANSAQSGQKRFTKSGAELQPMPEQTGEVRVDFPLTAEQVAVLQTGKAPEDDFDRWHVEVDGMHLRYYRNATGYCFFDLEIEPSGDGYLAGNMIVNQHDKQYTETNMAVCAAQVKILLANTLGLDDEAYWDEMDAASDE